jgi:ethanolamine utilization protein EutN
VIAARVVGKVTGSVKHETYDGRTLLALRTIRRGGELGSSFLAVDLVGSGVGDDVLVSRPPGLAREVFGRRAPIRSLIVGILDEPPA